MNIENKLDSLSRQVSNADIAQVRRVVDAAYALGLEKPIKDEPCEHCGDVDCHALMHGI